MHSYTPVVIIALILFSVYRRVSKTIGLQKIIKKSMIIRMTIFSIIAIIFLGIGLLNPTTYIFDVIGIVLGGIIAYYAIRTTTFEKHDDSWFYRPHPWISAIITVLFVGRIVYRVYQSYSLINSSVATNGQIENQSSLAFYAHDPSTSIVLFILISYYIIYYTFIIRRKGTLD